MTIAELSLKRPVTAIMFFVSMVVIGLIAAMRLPLEQFPSLDAPFLFVNIPYPGSTPTEIERTITRPVEEALATLPGIKRMNSMSDAESAQIFLEFKWGESMAIKAVQAREKIDGIRADLPSDLQRYTVQKFSTSDEPILKLRVATDERRPIFRTPTSCSIARSSGRSSAFRASPASICKASAGPRCRSSFRPIASRRTTSISTISTRGCRRRISRFRPGRSAPAARASACSRKGNGPASTTSAAFRSMRRACASATSRR